jgi:UDPglucose--hexose-1-phosphate uridylyltransferase
MHKLALQKPDGRRLTLYGQQPIDAVGAVRGPAGSGEPANPHLRWHPLRGEWIAYAAHRRERTFLPASFDPLAPSDSAETPTELPVGDYDIAVFDNLFPSLTLSAHDPPSLYVETQPGLGHCEVVVYSQDMTSLGSLGLGHIALLLEVWGDRTRELAREPGVRYVLPFENRGVEVGVTLHHPHGQIYAYGTVPPVPRNMHCREAGYFADTGTTLVSWIIRHETADASRLLYAGDDAVAFVPAFARFPYEVWVAPRRPASWLHELTESERLDCSRALKTVLRKLDGLWDRPFPYVMAWYQAPVGEERVPGVHLHAEFFPPYRARDRLKFLAGTELAAGLFASDTLPEQTAAELQAVPVALD